MVINNSDIVHRKCELLSHVYEVYDQIAESFESSCHRDCLACCTSGVIATTLEMLPIIEFLQQSPVGRYYDDALAIPDERKTRPTLTINDLARHCLERIEPPQEKSILSTVPCPLRDDNGCSVYEVRPFHCRSMFSSIKCRVDGAATMDPLIISLNGVFEQVIEHIDRGGFVGNMLNLLAAFDNVEFQESYNRSGEAYAKPHLLRAQPNPGFVVLPEHRQEIAAALAKLWEKNVRGIPFRDAMNLETTPTRF